MNTVPFTGTATATVTPMKDGKIDLTGFSRLLECIAANLPETSVRGSFTIPYDKGNLLNVIRAEGKIFSEEYTAEGTLIDALVDKKVYYMVEIYKN